MGGIWMLKVLRYMIAGTIAGATNGLLGAGGGMLLVPLLTFFCDLDDQKVFSSSVGIIFPICFVSLCISPGLTNLPWGDAWPYLIGAVPGGILAGILAPKIPVKWLHRALGILILYGGIHYLC